MKPAPRKYVFRRPWWRILAPFFFIGAIWGLPIAWDHILEQNVIPPQVNSYLVMGQNWIVLKGYKPEYLTYACIFLTVLCAMMFFKGIQGLVLTQDGLYRSYILWRTRSMPWENVREIRIDRVIRRLEDHRSTTRRLVLKFHPEVRWMWGPTITLDNDTFPDYPFAEAIAVRTGVSHISRRFYRDTVESGTPVTFAPMGFLCGLPGTLIYWLTAAIMVWAAGMTQWWQHPLMTHFPMLLFAGAAIMVIVGIDAFFYRQLGCDGRDLLIMRRNFIRKRVPIASLDLNNIDVHINSLKIYARSRKSKQSVCVFSTNNYLRNRAVLLCMLRSIYDYLRRQHIESQKSITQRMNVVDLAPVFRGEDAEGNVETAETHDAGAVLKPRQKPVSTDTDEFEKTVAEETADESQTPATEQPAPTPTVTENPESDTTTHNPETESAEQPAIVADARPTGDDAPKEAHTN